MATFFSKIIMITLSMTASHSLHAACTAHKQSNDITHTVAVVSTAAACIYSAKKILFDGLLGYAKAHANYQLFCITSRMPNPEDKGDVKLFDKAQENLLKDCQAAKTAIKIYFCPFLLCGAFVCTQNTTCID